MRGGTTIAYLSPIGRETGGEFQVFAGSANDNIYTEGWDKPIAMYAGVADYYERTARPVPLKPIDLYFHFFAIERSEGLALIERLLSRFWNGEVSPVYPSVYARSAQGAHSANITLRADGTWAVESATGLLELRVDESFGKVVDFDLSQNVIGYSKRGDRLYVHLAPDSSGPIFVRLGPNRAGDRPSLESAGGLISNFRWQQRAVTFRSDEFLKGPIRLQKIPFGPIQVFRDGALWKGFSKKPHGLVELENKPGQSVHEWEVRW